ncbi:zinc finger and BTB domain-containing protein 44-like isoform X1 [Pogonomyrmex barbatus]|uniref:Zinc finger and BTB domain-containing protein 44-like isoform X1 n=1 Tax=Pogonomyrmex barbatus TaxID=144034 RepID=A0A6I9W3P4_9HYME|nr:zinc finger and BTB domain-containing protein 44-like isoform X1 [Pogonomyrmex barbatus]
MSDEQFSLVWNSFPSNLSSGLYTLLTDEHLVDVTLAAEGQILRAHKLILSVCSTYFRELFKGNSCKHPIVILKDVNYRDLSAMLHFMYQGEVNIKQEDIASFLKVAEALQIKGLTTESDKKFKETLRRNDEDFEDRGFYEVDKDKCDPVGTDESVSTFGRLTHIVKEQSTTRQSTSTESTSTERPLMVQTSNATDACHWQGYTEGDYGPEIQTTFSGERCGSADGSSGVEEQPLDCTSDMSQLQPVKHEPLDYTMDTDADSGYRYTAEKVYASNENAPKQDFVPDTQLISYNQKSQTQPFGLNDAATYQSDFSYETTNSSNKGRRTVKGIPSSSLPLETTLRVVSQLGPTLRMEQGKIIRMYACPWCLRQFTRKENLKLHVRYIHGPLESLTCKLCGNKYKNSNSLRVHSYLYHNAKREKSGKSLAASGDDGDGDGGGGGV